MLSRVTEFAVGVYAVRHPFYLTNSYIVRSPKGVYLIDAGVYADGSDMVNALGQVGIRVEDVKGVLLTHWHNDHTGGAAAIRAAGVGPVHYHSAGADHFTGRVPPMIHQRLFDWMPDLGPLGLIKGIIGQCPPRPVAADALVGEGDRIDGLFQVWETPGHEAGHLSYWYPDAGLLFTGDAVAVCGDRLWYMSRYLTKDITQARSSMQRCLDAGATYICPGHRRPMRIDGGVDRDLRAHLTSGKAWPII